MVAYSDIHPSVFTTLLVLVFGFIIVRALYRAVAGKRPSGDDRYSRRHTEHEERRRH